MQGYPLKDSLTANRDSIVSLPDLSATIYAAMGSFISQSEMSLSKTYPLERIDSQIGEARWISIEAPNVTEHERFDLSVLNSRSNCLGGEKITCFSGIHDTNTPLTGNDLKETQAQAGPLLAELKKRIDSHEFHPSAVATPMTAAYEKCLELIKAHGTLLELKRDCPDSEVLDFLSWVQIESIHLPIT